MPMGAAFDDGTSEHGASGGVQSDGGKSDFVSFFVVKIHEDAMAFCHGIL
jgi:hypothetical protein